MRRMVIPWLWCPNTRLREGKAGASKATEGTGPAAKTALEAGMALGAGTTAEDVVRDSMSDAGSEKARVVISSHHYPTVMSDTFRSRFHNRRTSNISSRSHNRSNVSINTLGNEGSRLAKGSSNPGMSRPAAPR